MTKLLADDKTNTLLNAQLLQCHLGPLMGMQNRAKKGLKICIGAITPDIFFTTDLPLQKQVSLPVALYRDCNMI